LLSQLGRHAEALKAFGKAIKLNPGDSNAWFRKGFSLSGLGRHADAIEAYDTAIELKSDASYAWRWKGCSLGTLKRYAEAIESIDNAIKIKPDDYYSWYFKGFYLRRIDRHAEAIDAFTRAIELKPDDSDSWYWKGVSLSKLNRHKEAIAAIDEAIRLYPGNSNLRETKLEFENAINLKTDSGVGKTSKNIYHEKLSHPKWQKKRLEILQYANWRCQLCGNSEDELHVHHSHYEKNRDPWDYPNSSLIAVCKICHEKISTSRKN
jgi:tetratricopeptide (TPR) repeat protein